ncbi:hypothetical protein ABTX85_24370, partial [Streptomyces sp. NPDC096097]
MSAEERLRRTRHALEQMWSDPDETAERLQRFMARTDPAAPRTQAPVTAPPRASAHVTDATVAGREVRGSTLCHTDPRTSTTLTGPGTALPPDAHTPEPPAGRDGARMMDLVERAQAGEAEAFGRLYDQYSDTVYR